MATGYLLVQKESGAIERLRIGDDSLTLTGKTIIGGATTDLVGFYGAAGTARGAAIADAAGGVTADVEARAALNAVLARLRALGILPA